MEKPESLDDAPEISAAMRREANMHAAEQAEKVAHAQAWHKTKEWLDRLGEDNAEYKEKYKAEYDRVYAEEFPVIEADALANQLVVERKRE